jgi:hypothetical protein
VVLIMKLFDSIFVTFSMDFFFKFSIQLRFF